MAEHVGKRYVCEQVDFHLVVDGGKSTSCSVKPPRGAFLNFLQPLVDLIPEL